MFPKQQRQQCPTKDLYNSKDAFKEIICREPSACHRAMLLCSWFERKSRRRTTLHRTWAGTRSPPGNFSQSCGRQLDEFPLLHSEAKFRQLSLIPWLFSINSQMCNGLHGMSPYFWALNLPPLVGLTGSSAWVLHSFLHTPSVTNLRV